MSIGNAIKIAALLLALAWLPLIIVGGLGISDNPIGLGLLAMAGTALVAAWLIAFTVYRVLIYRPK